MHAYRIARLLLIAFTFALVTVGVSSAPASAKGTKDWTDTMSREDMFVQSCRGFDVTSSYTTVRKYHTVEDYTGQPVVERRTVTFIGTVANTENGQSFPFNGGFTRAADYDRAAVSISDLVLKLDPPYRSAVTVSIARLDHDLIDNPPAILLEFTPIGLREGLCSLFGSSPVSPDLGTTKSNESTSDDLTQWTEPDTCDTTPSGKPC
jgi:hypothetical protein